MTTRKLFAAVAAVGIVGAFSAQAAFLDDLAADVRNVQSSPYATGGDVILKLNDAEYIHVFTNPDAAGTFTVGTAALTGRILLVGGGGGGGGSNNRVDGGGGGGGFVESNSVNFAANDVYTVAVGTKGNAQNSMYGGVGGNGGNSSLTLNSETVAIAYGGGGGMAEYFNSSTLMAGLNGASGGGGIYGGAGGEAIYGDQGYAGGTGSSKGGGGGGGAGGPGESPVGTTNTDPKSHGGDGGIGRVSDILGYDQYFAGGGGGTMNGLKRHGNGGLGGGGKASDGNTYVSDGECGLGGGGGANGNPSNAGKPGRGGSGIVVIRYTIPSATTPNLGASTVVVEGGSIIRVSGIVLSSGNANATVKIKCWPTASGEDGGETVVNTVGSAVSANKSYVPFDEQIVGLSFDTAYSYKLWVENSSGSSTIATGNFVTYSSSLDATAVMGDDGLVPVSNGLDRVYIFTADGSFTIPSGRVGMAKVLVVAGGGAGGNGGGGGGAGGVIYDSAMMLTNGTYAISVGAGGTSGKGGNSIFGDLTAIGGGAGARPNRPSNAAGTDNEAGGSSAGAFFNRYSKYGTDGQGNAGGNAYQKSDTGQINGGSGYNGGGGGAGSAGGNATSAGGGNGGDGYPCAITGETLYYGAGGGGSYFYINSGIAGQGGLGGGGNAGSSTSVNGADGSFYGAGGGGGAMTTSSTGSGGKGYQGVVIVSYKDYSEAGSGPVVDIASLDHITTSSAQLTLDVSYAGSGASTVDLSVAWGDEDGVYTFGSKSVATDFLGVTSTTINGLVPGKTYYFQVTADNGSARGTAEGSFTTLSLWDGSVSISGLTDHPTIGLIGVRACEGGATANAEIWYGDDDSSLVCLTNIWNATTGGTLSRNDVAIPRTDYTVAKIFKIKYTFNDGVNAPVIIWSEPKTYYTVPRNMKLTGISSCVVKGGASGIADGIVAQNNMNAENSGTEFKLDFVPIGGVRHLTGARFVSRWWGQDLQGNDWRIRMAGVTFQYSLDGENWTDLYTVPAIDDMNPKVTDPGNPVWQPVVFPAAGVDARFFRWDAQVGGNVVEFELYTDDIRVFTFKPLYTACDTCQDGRVRSNKTTLSKDSDLDGGGMKFQGTMAAFESAPDVYVVASKTNLGELDISEWRTKGIVRQVSDATDTSWVYDFNDLENGVTYYYTAYVVAKEDSKLFWPRVVFKAIAGEGRWPSDKCSITKTFGGSTSNESRYGDGSISTVGWNRGAKGESYITWDLGADFVKKHRLSRVRLFYRGSVADRLNGGKIQVSADGVNWIDRLTLSSANVYKDGDGTINSITEISFRGADAYRYVRIDATDCTVHNNIELNEFEVLALKSNGYTILMVK